MFNKSISKYNIITYQQRSVWSDNFFTSTTIINTTVSEYIHNNYDNAILMVHPISKKEYDKYIKLKNK